MLKKVNLIVPQYHSCYCANNCKYCGFKSSNKLIPRNRLSFDDFKKEFDLLLDWGYRTIEFVFSSDSYFDADSISERIEYAKNLSIKRNLDLRIGLNSEPFDFSGYKRLYNSGLDFFVVWMETYSIDKYKYWHGLDTRKSNFEFRFHSYNRAIEAGLKQYGMGVLLGLNDWKEDVNSLIEHANSLVSQYNIPPYIIGLPRFKKAHSVNLNGEITKVSDEEFSLICSLYKKHFPMSMLFFNTRENFDVNISNLSNSDLFTIDCGTYPGAFINPEPVKNEYEQFHTQFYEREKITSKLKELGIKINYRW